MKFGDHKPYFPGKRRGGEERARRFPEIFGHVSNKVLSGS
jgi:hypothetical protein